MKIFTTRFARVTESTETKIPLIIFFFRVFQLARRSLVRSLGVVRG